MIDIERLKARLTMKAKAEYQQAKLAWNRAQEKYAKDKRAIRQLAPELYELILQAVPSDLNGTSSVATTQAIEAPKQYIPQYKRVSDFIGKQNGQFTIKQIVDSLKIDAPALTEKFVGNVLFKLKKDGLINMDQRGGRHGISLYSRKNGKVATH